MAARYRTSPRRAYVMMPGMASRRSRIWIVWLALGFAGVLAVVPAVVAGVRAIASTLAAPSRTTPGTIQTTLRAGDHVILERISTAGESFADDEGTTLTPRMVSVTGPAGQVVPVRSSVFTGTITQGMSVYRSALSFEAPQAGRYAIEVGGEPGAVLVTPSLGEAFGQVVPWLVVAALGALAALVGGTGLVVSLIRGGARERNRPHGQAAPGGPVAAASTGAPAGWYLDPGGSGRWRYWDGASWSSEVS